MTADLLVQQLSAVLSLVVENHRAYRDGWLMANDYLDRALSLGATVRELRSSLEVLPVC